MSNRKIQTDCPICGITFMAWLDNYRLRGFAHCGRKCSAKAVSMKFRGSKSHRWKGGRTIHPAGYVLVSPEGDTRRQQLEHRIVMEKLLGRLLDPNEIVHHKNGDRTDNKPGNLELVNGQSAHLAIHFNRQPITEDIKSKIRKLHGPNMGYGKLANLFGIGKTTVARIIKANAQYPEIRQDFP